MNQVIYRQQGTIIKLLVVVFLCLPALGCGTVIRPASYPQMPKYFKVADARAALVLSKDIQGYTFKGSPSSMTGALQTYEFQLGAVLSEALREGVSSAFTNVTVLSQRPADASAYDLIIEPRVAAFDFAIGDDGGMAKSFLFGALGAAATGYSSNVIIRLQADVRDGKGKPIGVFSGNGQGSKPAGAFTWKMSDFNQSAGAAVSSAVAKLVGEVSNAYQKMRLPGAVKTSEKPVTEKKSHSSPTKQGDPSPKERLRELKKLLDDGLINQEDYDQKKRQILKDI